MGSNPQIHVKNCFGCDPDNPIGLKAVFAANENCITGYFQSDKNHQGPPGYVHGGIISAFIDEGCSYYARKFFQCDILTIRNEIRFKNPARLGDMISIEIHAKNEKNRTVTISSKVYSDGKVTAIGESSLMKIQANV
ncbi:MAG: hotdog fold thioesterase [Desulfobacterales bacterium]|nr:hotdog fold thioesterase [Desulfobacterales bacterium]